uniref:acyl-CoA dehydrogenase n=1 Tax=Polynucleobacter sp. TaxID=2029855 RepID=UPI0040483641
MPYTAPVKEMLFVMNEIAGLSKVVAYPAYAEAGADVDLAAAILEEAAKFNQDIIAPLNWPGDQHPSALRDGVVHTTPGFKEAFKQFAAAGWQGVVHPPQFGGQGLPKLISTACFEMANSANMSFALCPMLTDGAIEALLTAASPELQERYVPKMISGEWTGTMNLTEPQAGSDLSMVRTRAEPQDDGSYRIFGTKIYITYGDHDMAQNIVHLVLARLPNAPDGIKGISLFVAPKFLINTDNTLGEHNDIECVSLEHKLGIKASPTAVLQFGDHQGAVAYLVGEENRGLEYMFVMMNAARFSVGMQGVAVAERAYQKAVRYAKDRLQSPDLSGSDGPVAIIQQPDVKRMLMTMRAYTEGSRALAYYAAAAYDAQHADPDALDQKNNQAIYEFLVPIIKGFATEMSIDVASLGVQVHGGMGFIEETGAAQYYRDARILTIYEGTTAIQANDLVGRKTVRDGGTTAMLLAQKITQTEDDLAKSATPDALAVLNQLKHARADFESVVGYIVTHAKSDIKAVYAGSVPYLRLCGLVLCAWQMARSLLIAEDLRADDVKFYDAKVATARFFAEHLLPQTQSLSTSILEGGCSTNALSPEQF